MTFEPTKQQRQQMLKAVDMAQKALAPAFALYDKHYDHEPEPLQDGFYLLLLNAWSELHKFKKAMNQDKPARP